MPKRNKTNCKSHAIGSYSRKIANNEHEVLHHRDYTSWKDKYSKKLKQEAKLNEVTNNE